MGTEEQREERLPCFCPYCETRLEGGPDDPCQACHVMILYCPQCRKPVSRGIAACPHCGTKVQG